MFNNSAEFPTEPIGTLKRFIADEADAQLARYIPMPENEHVPLGVELPSKPQLPEGTVDAPLIRLFNFLRKYFKVDNPLAQFFCRDDVTILPVGSFMVSGEFYLFPPLSLYLI